MIRDTIKARIARAEVYDKMTDDERANYLKENNQFLQEYIDTKALMKKDVEEFIRKCEELEAKNIL